MLVGSQATEVELSSTLAKGYAEVVTPRAPVAACWASELVDRQRQVRCRWTRAWLRLLLFVFCAACVSPGSETTRGDLGAAHPPSPPGGDKGTLGISRDEDAALLPGPPPDLTVEVIDANHLQLVWGATGSDILTHFAVYRRCEPESEWTPLGEKIIDDLQAKEFRFSTENLQRACRYGVAAVDHYGNEGPKVETSTP